MRLDEWEASQHLQDEWRKTWREPHMQAGLEVLTSQICEVGFAVPSGTSAIDAGALRDACHQGFKMAVKTIELMTGLSARTPAPEIAPAYSLTPEEEEDEPKPER